MIMGIYRRNVTVIAETLPCHVTHVRSIPSRDRPRLRCRLSLRLKQRRRSGFNIGGAGKKIDMKNEHLVAFTQGIFSELKSGGLKI